MRPPTRPYGAPHEDLRPPRDPRLAGRLSQTAALPAFPRGLAIHHVDTGPAAAATSAGRALGAPPVLLLHGVFGTHAHFREVILRLSDEHRVLAPDLPGCGRSEKPDAPYDPDWLAAATWAFLDAKGIDRVDVVGNSLGGQVALCMAARQPARVGRLVLAAPAGFLPYDGALTRLVDGLGILLGDTLRPRVGLPSLPRIPGPALRLLLRSVFPGRPDLVNAWLPAYTRGLASSEYPLHVRAGYRALRGSVARPMADVASQLQTPSLVVWGDEDRILPPRGAALVDSLLSGATVRRYPGVGHCPMVETPETFVADLRAFLDPVGSPAGPACPGSGPLR